MYAPGTKSVIIARLSVRSAPGALAISAALTTVVGVKGSMSERGEAAGASITMVGLPETGAGASWVSAPAAACAGANRVKQDGSARQKAAAAGRQPKVHPISLNSRSRGRCAVAAGSGSMTGLYLNASRPTEYPGSPSCDAVARLLTLATGARSRWEHGDDLGERSVGVGDARGGEPDVALPGRRGPGGARGADGAGGPRGSGAARDADRRRRGACGRRGAGTKRRGAGGRRVRAFRRPHRLRRHRRRRPQRQGPRGGRLGHCRDERLSNPLREDRRDG